MSVRQNSHLFTNKASIFYDQVDGGSSWNFQKPMYYTFHGAMKKVLTRKVLARKVLRRQVLRRKVLRRRVLRKKVLRRKVLSRKVQNQKIGQRVVRTARCRFRG